MPRVDPAAAAKAYQEGMASGKAQQNYKNGVQAVTQSPTAAAATPDATQRYVDGVQRSVNSGKRAQKLAAVSLSDWQQATIQKGASRLASGAQAAAQKVQAHFQKWAPIYQQASDAAKALPKGGKANAMARVQASLDVLMGAAGTS